MRPSTHPCHSHPDADPAATRLDRAWAATRPDAPAPELLDALWAHASAELDRLGAAPELEPGGALGRRRSRVRVGSGLAVAATLLLVAGLALRSRDGGADGPVGPPAPTVAVTVPAPARVADLLPPRPQEAPTSPARPIIDVGVDQTLVVTIDADGPRVDLRPQAESLVAANSNTLIEGTARDVFNAWESCATP